MTDGRIVVPVHSKVSNVKKYMLCVYYMYVRTTYRVPVHIHMYVYCRTVGVYTCTGTPVPHPVFDGDLFADPLSSNCHKSLIF